MHFYVFLAYTQYYMVGNKCMRENNAGKEHIKQEAIRKMHPQSKHCLCGLDAVHALKSNS